MPLPRFHRLEPDKQSQILDAAAKEFGAHGYGAASMNRIIEAAGLSKGAMYYYFDGKVDLWGTLVQDVFEAVDPIDRTLGRADSVETFWAAFRRMYEDVLRSVGTSPRVSNMMRAMTLSTNTAEAMQVLASTQGLQGLRDAMTRVLQRGRSLGAVRMDLTTEQLIDIVFGLNTVTDAWLAKASVEQGEQAALALVDTLLDLNVRLLRP